MGITERTKFFCKRQIQNLDCTTTRSLFFRPPLASFYRLSLTACSMRAQNAVYAIFKPFFSFPFLLPFFSRDPNTLEKILIPSRLLQFACCALLLIPNWQIDCILVVLYASCICSRWIILILMSLNCASCCTFFLKNN